MNRRNFLTTIGVAVGGMVTAFAQRSIPLVEVSKSPT
jgi:hypothetical protein